jgi:YebC/PmpR family DNA-binding regulatory protein
MSGHSHWAGIKHKKGIADAKKSKAFSKIAREITVAAKEGGNDPEFNPKLRITLEKARSLNMPGENIERAIKKGTGELAGENLENITLEAYGPEGLAIIIEGITDNKNRAISGVKQILSKYGGKLVGEGSVKWLFDRRGCITVNPEKQTLAPKNKEELELIAIEAGARDIYWHNDNLDIYTNLKDLEKVRQNLEKKEIKTGSTTLDWVAKEEISLSKESENLVQKLFADLDEDDSVQEIYSNLKI